MRKNLKISVLILVVLLFLLPATVLAAEEKKENTKDEEITQEDVKKTQEDIMNDIDLKDAQKAVDQILGQDKMDFGATVKKLISGETDFSFQLLGDLISDQIFYEWNYNKSTLVHILLIALAAAVFTNFSAAFSSQQISEVSFYMIYLLLLTILMKSFSVMADTASQTLEQLMNFMQALGPAYFLSVAFASGGTTATVFYQFILFFIYIVNFILQKLILPFVHIYVVLILVNNLSKEDFLSKLADLIKTIISWAMKTLLTVVIGFNVIQGLISPVLDSFRHSLIGKAGGAIPVVGGAVNAVTEVVIGSAVLIKNGIGVAALIVLAALCIIPVLKLVIFVLMYKLTAAAIQPISDKRMVESISGMGEGAALLLKIVAISAVLFMITIAVVAASTS